MGRAKERWFLFFFLFFLSSRFSCSLTPQVFYSLLCTVPRWSFESFLRDRCAWESGAGEIWGWAPNSQLKSLDSISLPIIFYCFVPSVLCLVLVEFGL
jgi:hypothetical protein